MNTDERAHVHCTLIPKMKSFRIDDTHDVIACFNILVENFLEQSLKIINCEGELSFFFNKQRSFITSIINSDNYG